MTYAMPFQQYAKTVLRVAASSSARCFTTMCGIQRVDLGIDPYGFGSTCLLRQPFAIDFSSA